MLLTLQAARVNAGLSQADVLNATGIARSTLTRWERGITVPSARNREVLCGLYTQAEFQAYVWDEKVAMHGEDRPVKENDHCMDAVRYFVSTVLQRNQVRVGQRPKGM